MTLEDVKARARAQAARAIEVRRRLHAVPEKGFEETKTRALICEELRDIGCEFQEKNGWITAYIPGGAPGPVTGLRADFDALPVTEPEGCAFRSAHEGWMHACGHDMHTAILLGTARLLWAARGAMAGGAKLLFQPAEETVGGAKPMVRDGAMQNPRVDRVFGLHVMPRLVTGQVECRPGTLNAGTDGVHIVVNGTSSHGAYPESGRDAIVCAAHLICALQTLVSRNLSPLESAVLSIGMIEGGRASNILCDSVKLTGTLRTANKAVRDMMIARMKDVCAGVCAAMGCAAEVRIEEGYAALVNHAQSANAVLDTARRLFGADCALVKDAPSMGGEDFSYFLNEAPGAFFHIGCSRDAAHIGAPLHSELFCPDENCVWIGIAMEAALALGL